MDVERENSGFLFKNDRKEEDHHSDYQGSVNIDGNQMWINAWLKTGKDGRKYLSLSFKFKESRARVQSNNHANAGNGADPSDLIPF